MEEEMARIYPRTVDSDTASFAERKLHEAFARQLPDDYFVFHSARWQAYDKTYGVQEAEADFILVSPSHGVLLLEVKGGNIAIDGESQQWYSNGNIIKNPINQAQANKYKLIRFFERLPEWRGITPQIAYAVAFPDVVVRGPLGASIAPELLLDQSDMVQLTKWVASAFACAFGTNPTPLLGSERLKLLVDLFSPSRRLYTRIGGEIVAEAREQDELTQQQFRLLSFLGNRQRVAIQGCAGSGKTMIAIEQARRLAAQGCRVLFVCFNRALPARLKSHPSLGTGVDVYHFHGLCEVMAERAGIAVPPAPDGENSDYFNRTLPDLLIDATAKLGAQYDAIIVDEGQDMRDEWWASLEFLLREESGFFFVFHDPSQNLYARSITLPDGMENFPLFENCRNTRKIHTTVAAYYAGEDKIEPRGPEGRDPEVILYRDERDLHKRLAGVLHRLTFEENVRPEDIVILTQRRYERTAFRDRATIGNWKLTQQWPPAANEIFITTIYQFKGLESPVVILAEISESKHQNLDTLLYVGCSRAKNHLVLLAQEEMQGKLGENLPVAHTGE